MRITNVVVIAILVVMLKGYRATSQSTSDASGDGWSAPIPKKDRPTFLFGFKKVISLRKQQAWSDLYDLLNHDDGVTREQFAKNMNRLDALVEFQPRAMFYVPSSNAWAIKGCGRYRKLSGQRYSVPSVMHAYCDAGHRWLYGDLAVETDKSYKVDMRSCEN